jgi:hypothetical protein
MIWHCENDTDLPFHPGQPDDLCSWGLARHKKRTYPVEYKMTNPYEQTQNRNRIRWPPSLAYSPTAGTNIEYAFGGTGENMFIAKQAAPMVQAIILMMIYMLLLIYMIMSDYDIDATIQMIFIILGIQFFTTIWNFADYLDARLFVSMHPDATLLGSVWNMGMNRLILDIVLTILYVVAPFLLLWVMNMAGSKVKGLAGAAGGLGKAGKSGAGQAVRDVKIK